MERIGWGAKSGQTCWSSSTSASPQPASWSMSESKGGMSSGLWKPECGNSCLANAVCQMARCWPGWSRAKQARPGTTAQRDVGAHSFLPHQR